MPMLDLRAPYMRKLPVPEWPADVPRVEPTRKRNPRWRFVDHGSGLWSFTELPVDPDESGCDMSHVTEKGIQEVQLAAHDEASISYCPPSRRFRYLGRDYSRVDLLRDLKTECNFRAWKWSQFKDQRDADVFERVARLWLAVSSFRHRDCEFSLTFSEAVCK